MGLAVDTTGASGTGSPCSALKTTGSFDAASRNTPVSPHLLNVMLLGKTSSKYTPSCLERVHDPLDFGPVALELLALVRLPIRPDLLGELRPRVKVSTGEIQNEWGV